MDSFKHSFGLDDGQSAATLAALNGNIVSVLQGKSTGTVALSTLI